MEKQLHFIDYILYEDFHLCLSLMQIFVKAMISISIYVYIFIYIYICLYIYVIYICNDCSVVSCIKRVYMYVYIFIYI